MFFRDMAGGAGEVQSGIVHVHVQRVAGVDQGGIQIPMFDPIAAAAIEVAAPTVFPSWQADALGDLRPLDRLLALKHHRAGLVALGWWRLVIGAGAVMTDQTVDIVLIAEVEAVVFPAEARVALGAHALVSAGIGAEVVDQITLAEQLPRLFVLVCPGPVNILHELVAGLGMTFQADPGHLRAIAERALELFELAMIGG